MSQYTTNRLMSDGFTTIQTPSGTYPVADSPSDVLTLTSSDGSVAIVGNAVTDTIDLTVTPSGAGYAFGTIDVPIGSNPVAGSVSDTVTFTSGDNFLNIKGDAGSKTVDYQAGPFAIALAIIFG